MLWNLIISKNYHENNKSDCCMMSHVFAYDASKYCNLFILTILYVPREREWNTHFYSVDYSFSHTSEPKEVFLQTVVSIRSRKNCVARVYDVPVYPCTFPNQ